MRKLIDRFGHRINYLRVSVTDRCNLKCIYCSPVFNNANKTSKEILSYEEIIKIIKVAVSLGINKIRLTGGEPLIREGLIYLIESLSKINNIDDLSLTTNGIFLSEYVNELKKVGIKRINISLDTLDKEKYKFITGYDGLNKVFDGINKSLQAGLNPLKINVVVMKNITDNEIVEFAKLTFKEPLHIRFIEYMPINCSIHEWKERFISNDEIKIYCESLGELKPIKIFQDGNISESYKFKNAKGTISFISAISKPFCHKCSRLRLTSDGKLRLCLGQPHEVDIKKILRCYTEKNELVEEIIKQKIILAVKLKPQGHMFNSEEYSIPQRTMCSIGG